LGDIHQGLGALQADLTQLGSSRLDGLIQQVGFTALQFGLGVVGAAHALLQADLTQLGSSRLDGLIQQGGFHGTTVRVKHVAQWWDFKHVAQW
jgi:hypothetical protein